MIKRFESFKNPTYFEIDEVEAEKLVSNAHGKQRRILNQMEDAPKFTKDEIKKIKTLTPKNCLMGAETKDGGPPTDINFVPQQNWGHDSIVSEIIIWKSLDEWYVIEISFHTDNGDVAYWKCDQLDGLVDFLRSQHLKTILEI